MATRVYAPSVYDGDTVSIDTAKERRALIGKRVGYDIHGSMRPRRGVVTDAYRTWIEIDGYWIDKSAIDQIVVLRDQGE